MELTTRGAASIFACVAAATVAGCAGSVTGQPPVSTTARAATTTTPSTLAANEAAARRDARKLLALVRLPAGAVRVPVQPSGDAGLLKPGQGQIGDSASADRYAWWVLRRTPAAVLRFVKAHPPVGATLNNQGSSGVMSDQTASGSSLGFEWPAVPGVMSARELTVMITKLTDGKTGVLADVQSDWVVPRSPAEKVPKGITTVTVTLTRAPAHVGGKHAGPRSKVVLTARSKVARAIKLVDTLGVVQPVTIVCPAMLLPEGSLTVTYSAGPAGPALAQARVSVPTGGGSGTQCDSISFSIRGKAQTSLLGTGFAPRIAALAGLTLR